MSDAAWGEWREGDLARKTIYSVEKAEERFVDQSELAEATRGLATKAELAEIQAGGADLSGYAKTEDVRKKADKADLTRLSETVATKAEASAVAGLTRQLAGKADQGAVQGVQESVETLNTQVEGLRGRVGTLDQTSQTLNEAVGGLKGRVESLETAPKAGGPVFGNSERHYFGVTYLRPDLDRAGNSEFRKFIEVGPLGMVVLDHSDHDWAQEVPAYGEGARAAKAAGAKVVLWYVPTHKGMAGNPGAWGEGREDASKWSHEEIIRQLKYCKAFYGDVFEGVFLDEVSSGLDSHAARIPWYKELIQKLKAEFGQGFFVFGNPGTDVAKGILEAGFDALCTFEDSAEEYLKPNAERKKWLRVSDAVAKAPASKIVHMVRDVTEKNLKDVYARADKEGAGHLFVTDRGLTAGSDPLGVPAVSPYAKAPAKFATEPMGAWASRTLSTFWAAKERPGESPEEGERVLVDSMEGGRVYDAATLRISGGNVEVLNAPTDTWRGDAATKVFEVPQDVDMTLSFHVVHTGAVPASLQVKTSYGTSETQPRSVWTKGGSFTVDPTGDGGRDYTLTLPASDTQGNTHAMVTFRFNGTRWEGGRASLSNVRLVAPGKAVVPGGADLSAYAKKTEVAEEAQKAAQAAVADRATKNEVQQAVSGLATKSEVSGLAKKSDVDSAADAARRAAENADKALAALSPFEIGRKYYSPVTYYWPDFYKDEDSDDSTVSEWGKALRAGPDLGIVILNKSSGTWDVYDKDFDDQGKRAKVAGAKRVIFYVKTQYGAAGNQSWQNGVPNPDKYTKDHILGQLRNIKRDYGNLAEGVFLDEFINGWGDHAVRVSWYRDLVNAIRAEFGRDFLIAGNPGANVSPDVLALDVDVFMSFEQDAKKYLETDAKQIHTADMAKHPSTRFWHVIHGVNKTNYRAVFAKAESLGVSHLYVTDGVLVEDPEHGGQWEPVGNPYEKGPGKTIVTLTSEWLRGLTGVSNRLAALEAKPEPDLSGLASKQDLSLYMARADVEAYVKNAIEQALKGLPTPPTPQPEDPNPLVPKVDPGWNNTKPYLAKFRSGEGKTSTMPITLIGDSWTGGNVTERGGANKTSERWDNIVKAGLNNFAIQNQGISGQLTSDYLIYSGYSPFVVSSIEGNTIPAGANVEKRVELLSPNLDTISQQLFRNNVKSANGYITYWQVTLDGVLGYMRLRWDDQQKKNYFTFARTQAGAEHPLAPGSYKCETAIERTITNGAQFIVELGINDAFQHYSDEHFAEKYLANMRNIIEKAGSAYAGSQPSHLMVLTIPPMSGEQRDAPRRKAIDKANAELVKEFGPFVLDIASYLTSEQALTDAGVEITAGDREDLAQRSLPRSLMGDVWQKPGTFDATHMNAAGNKALGRFILAEIKRRQWVA